MATSSRYVQHRHPRFQALPLSRTYCDRCTPRELEHAVVAGGTAAWLCPVPQVHAADAFPLHGVTCVLFTAPPVCFPLPLLVPIH